MGDSQPLSGAATLEKDRLCVMRLFARIAGALTVVGLLFIASAWALERQVNPHPKRVAGDYAKAAFCTAFIGGSVTLVLGVGSRRPAKLLDESHDPRR